MESEFQRGLFAERKRGQLIALIAVALFLTAGVILGAFGQVWVPLASLFLAIAPVCAVFITGRGSKGDKKTPKNEDKGT